MIYDVYSLFFVKLITWILSYFQFIVHKLKENFEFMEIFGMKNFNYAMILDNVSIWLQRMTDDNDFIFFINLKSL